MVINGSGGHTCVWVMSEINDELQHGRSKVFMWRVFMISGQSNFWQVGLPKKNGVRSFDRKFVSGIHLSTLFLKVFTKHSSNSTKSEKFHVLWEK